MRASQNAQKEEEAFETSSFGTDSNFSDKCKQDQKDRDDVELDTERQPDSMRELLPADSQGRKIPRASVHIVESSSESDMRESSISKQEKHNSSSGSQSGSDLKSV